MAASGRGVTATENGEQKRSGTAHAMGAVHGALERLRSVAMVQLVAVAQVELLVLMPSALSKVLQVDVSNHKDGAVLLSMQTNGGRKRLLL